MEQPTGYELNSRKSNFMDEEIKILYIKDDEYPFLVTNGCRSFDCISWNEACDKFEHFYAYSNQPIERIDYAA